jgi:hypothetical protein
LAWAAKRGIRIGFIQPGQPQQNAYVERYNRTVRYDWLAHHLFDTLDEIQDFTARWLWTYNHDRPNMGLGGITPKQKLALAAQPLLLACSKNGGITTPTARPALRARLTPTACPALRARQRLSLVAKIMGEPVSIFFSCRRGHVVRRFRQISIKGHVTIVLISTAEIRLLSMLNPNCKI